MVNLWWAVKRTSPKLKYWDNNQNRWQSELTSNCLYATAHAASVTFLELSDVGVRCGIIPVVYSRMGLSLPKGS